MLDEEWFDDPSIVQIKKHISLPKNFTKSKTHNKYDNVITNVYKSNNKYKFNVPYDTDYNDVNIYTHKYFVYFTDFQKSILKKYFVECLTIYNLCVNIYNLYNDITTEWRIVKDVIFDVIYRNNNNNLTLKQKYQLIIDSLKQKKVEYDLENNPYKEAICQAKLIAKQKYIGEMKIYREQIKRDTKLGIKSTIKKPRLKQVKIDKVKKPPKDRRPNIKKPAPDDSLKGQIKEFCTNLSNAKQTAFNNEHYDKTTKKINYEFVVLKHKTLDKKQTIKISNRNISSNGICINSLGKIEDSHKSKCIKFKDIIKKYNNIYDCELSYDPGLNKYYILIPVKKNYIEIKNKKEIVALDPGVKIFNYYFSNNEYGMLGEESEKKILLYHKEINRYKKLINTKINTSKKHKGKKISNVCKLKKTVLHLRKKLKGYINNVHK